jgi:alkylated DNA repair dioxygenase AlkB
MQDADVVLYRQFFTPAESDVLLQTLTNTIDWKQETIRVPGKAVPLPRLTAWYGDEGATYRYSGLKQTPLPWTPILSEIKARIDAVANVRFNSVLLNLYRSETDSVNWHADDEPELGDVIASVSFGAVRKFQFKHIDDPDQRLSIDLPHGSLLIMRGTTQQYWFHRIPKAKTLLQQRINLTFRIIHDRSS